MKAGTLLCIGLIGLAFDVFSGCSVRPFKSERVGLLDRLSRLPAANRSDLKPEGKDDEEVLVGKGPEAEQIVAQWHEVRRKAESWRWPLDEVRVTSSFGKRGAQFHEGVDLKAPSGTPVYAVQAGRVIYAGNKIGGYGKMVIIRHPGGLSSIYAHNSKLTVKVGQRVHRGEKIGVSGSTGKSKGPHLHFEVRSGITPVDPARLLAIKPPQQSGPERKIADAR